MLRVLVTGKSGQVVTAVRDISATLHDIDLITIGRPEVDLACPEDLKEVIIAARPDVIISLAAYTAVDKAETEADIAERVNAVAPGELARIARQLDIPVLHLSTDYVFSGNERGLYTENAAVSPINVYGRTKLGGELVIARATPDHVILRTSWVYSPFGHNFVKTMLKLAETRDAIRVVADQQGCPTSALEIADALIHIARRIAKDTAPELRGIFHLTGSGDTNWADFARAIFDGLEARGGRHIDVTPIMSSEYPTPAARPKNSRLNCEKIKQIYGIVPDPWRVSLDACLDRLILSR